MISYDPLFRLLEKQGKPQSYLLENGIDSRILQRLRTDSNITTKTLARICIILECQPNDVMEVLLEKSSEQEGEH